MFWAEIWKISEIYLKIFSFLEVKFSIYLNRRVFVMVMRKRVFRHMQTAQYCTFVQSNQGIHRPLHVTGSVDTKECINGPKARIILCACARCESLHSAPRMPVFARRSPYGHVLYYAWRRNAETCWTAAWEPAKRRPTITRASDQGHCFPFTKKQSVKNGVFFLLKREGTEIILE